IVWLPAAPPAEILSIEQAGESLGRFLLLRCGGDADAAGNGDCANEDSRDVIHVAAPQSGGLSHNTASRFQLPASRTEARRAGGTGKNGELGAGSWELIDESEISS